MRQNAALCGNWLSAKTSSESILLYGPCSGKRGLDAF